MRCEFTSPPLGTRCWRLATHRVDGMYSNVACEEHARQFQKAARLDIKVTELWSPLRRKPVMQQAREYLQRWEELEEKRLEGAKGGRVKKRGLQKLSDANRLEALAKLVHESGRKAVETGNVVNKVPGQPFYDWDMLTPEAQTGRRLMAKFLLDKRRRKAVRRLFA